MDSDGAELRVELESASLKKELRTRDLVFTQILYIVGLSWIGYAGKLGSSHASFWVLALLLFYIPSCVVVIHLNRQMPLEGGLYQWAKLRFGAMAGFMVAWNIWLFSILFISVGGLRVADMASYALGPAGAWIANSKWLIVNPLRFTAKIVAFIVVANGIAAGLYWRAERRRAVERRIVIQ